MSTHHLADAIADAGMEEVDDERAEAIRGALSRVSRSFEAWDATRRAKKPCFYSVSVCNGRGVSACV